MRANRSRQPWRIVIAHQKRKGGGPTTPSSSDRGISGATNKRFATVQLVRAEARRVWKMMKQEASRKFAETEHQVATARFYLRHCAEEATAGRRGAAALGAITRRYRVPRSTTLHRALSMKPELPYLLLCPRRV